MVGAPWIIYDHYLVVKPWTPDFVAANSEISTAAVWIRIPDLGFQFYDESILLTLASAVGTPIRVDMNTMDMQRGKYARICVEIDLSKPVLGRVGLRGVWYNIEYEGLHLLCSHCGCYGHLARNCTGTPMPKQNPSPAATTKMPQEAAGPVACTPQDATQTETLVTEQTMMEAVIPGVKIAPITCPDSAHGQWLSVTRKGWKSANSSQKKHAVGNQLHTRISSGNNGGKKGKDLMTFNVVTQINTGGAPQNKSDNLKTPAIGDVTKGRKRIRKDITF
ncbi:uncharacterized protein LOC130725170 [Lotus japonicus]|uniref:uncharacterized protein LOC130725170 n=1 Tax=Lotus japonicus TaxID=34305 RepID=UPI00258647B0|nr:uncharacterized protein LOC130725170 [Lotus japonicus]